MRNLAALLLLASSLPASAAVGSWEASLNGAIQELRAARPLLHEAAAEDSQVDALERALIQASEAGAAGSVKIELRPGSSGSGFVVESPLGPLIVTNAHVVQREGIYVKVFHGDGAPLPGLVLGVNKRYDLALVRLVRPCPSCAALAFSAERPRPGAFAIVVGAPLGLEGTVTIGHVSHVGRRYGSGLVDDYIQLDAAVNPGNSGGALLDARGRVLGVVSSIISPGSGFSDGIALAIPYWHAQHLLERYANTGAIASAGLDAPVRFDAGAGRLVVWEAPDAPAAAADGLRPGDVLLALDGRALDGLDYGAFIRLVADKVPGQDAAFQVRRGEQVLDVLVPLKGE